VKLPGAAEYLARSGGLRLVAALTSMAVAVVLCTRFGIGGTPARGEAVCACAGQQPGYGVPPYAGIFDAKTPLASMIAGVAAAVAHLAGGNDICLIRAAFFVCACHRCLAGGDVRFASGLGRPGRPPGLKAHANTMPGARLRSRRGGEPEQAGQVPSWNTRAARRAWAPSGSVPDEQRRGGHQRRPPDAEFEGAGLPVPR
jgi:hypothetical protein